MRRWKVVLRSAFDMTIRDAMRLPEASATPAAFPPRDDDLADGIAGPDLHAPAAAGAGEEVGDRPCRRAAFPSPRPW